MTAHAMQGDRERCLEAGMNDFVTYPVQPKDLALMLKRWLQKMADIPRTVPAVVAKGASAQSGAHPPGAAGDDVPAKKTEEAVF